MKLLAILIAFGLERYYRVFDHLRSHQWIYGWILWLEDRFSSANFWRGLWAAIWVALPIALLVQLIYVGLDEVLGLFGLLWGIGILVLSFGPRDLAGEVRELIELFERDREGGLIQAQRFLGREGELHVHQAARGIATGVFVQANQRIFAVLFWFILLGPLGAVFYRIVDLDCERSDASPGHRESALRLREMLSWIPAHLVALSYAVVGDFSASLRALRKNMGDWAQNTQMLSCAGLGALRLECAEADEASEEWNAFDRAEIEEALDLVRRSEVLWMAALAVLILAGLLI